MCIIRICTLYYASNLRIISSFCYTIQFTLTHVKYIQQTSNKQLIATSQEIFKCKMLHNEWCEWSSEELMWKQNFSFNAVNKQLNSQKVLLFCILYANKHYITPLYFCSISNSVFSWALDCFILAHTVSSTNSWYRYRYASIYRYNVWEGNFTPTLIYIDKSFISLQPFHTAYTVELRMCEILLSYFASSICTNQPYTRRNL